MVSLSSRAIMILWLGLAAALTAMTAALTIASPLFGYDVRVFDMPVFQLTGGLIAAGLLFLVLPWLVRRTLAGEQAALRPLLWLVIGAGLAMRAILFASEPVLEDDYQRYLWDGAVTAHGLNPYGSSPAQAKLAYGDSTLGRLARQSGPVLDRINHPDLRTIYPPVAQAAFAFAHTLSPFSLTAWRAVILLCDLAALGALLVLLRDLGRSPLWAALYWWNPVVLKELFNSAHMDAIIIPLILAALALTIRGRLLFAGVSLLLAAGAKIWPLLLLPLLWRPLLAAPARALLAAAIAICAMGLLAAPFVLSGLDETSGLLAYAQKWKTNSALFPLLEQLFAQLPGAAAPGAMARIAIAGVLGVLSLHVARTPFTGADDLVKKALLVASALFLLSPAQFPWYYLWVLPLLACRPSGGLLLASATLPLYYSAFHFLARSDYEVFTGMVVWFVWIPVWLALAWETAPLRTAARTFRRTRKERVPT